MNINENDPNTSQAHQVSIYFNRNGFIRPGRQRQINKPNIQHHIQNQQIIQQHGNQIAGANPNGIMYSMQNLNLLDNNVVILNSDGIPIMQKSESDSGSSGESIDDTTPPDTPLTQTHSSKSGSNKQFKTRDQQSVMSRHQVVTSTPPMIYNNQLQPQSHTVLAQSQQIPVVQSDIMLSPAISPQQQQQLQPSQHQQQNQQPPQSTMNLSLTNMTASNTNNNNLVTSTVLITNKHGQNITTPTMSGFSIGGNPPVLFQQYPAPPPPHHIQQGIPQSQLNTTYHYHTHNIPINNRGSIITTPNTTSPGPQTTSYRLPPYHVQPNGEVLYPFPSTIAYIQSTPIPLSRPSNHPQTHPIVPQPTHSNTIQQQTKSLPTYQTTPEVKANLSCFNCGSPFHTGRECQEASMEDVTRGTIYKLDYNSPLDLDNSGNVGEVSTNEPTSLPTSVINK